MVQFSRCVGKKWQFENSVIWIRSNQFLGRVNTLSMLVKATLGSSNSVKEVCYDDDVSDPRRLGAACAARGSAVRW